MSIQSAQLEPAMPGSRSQATAAAAGMLAAWFAAGSVGLVAPALLVVLSWLALAVSAVAARLRPGWTGSLGVLVVAAASACSPETTLSQPFAVSAMLALFAARTQGTTSRLLSMTCIAALSLALFRMVQYTVPAAWLLADRLGQGLGTLAGTIAGLPLSTGSSFAGLDFLVSMFAFVIAWRYLAVRPSWTATCLTVAAILAAQLLYLTGLAVLPMAANLLPAIPEPVPTTPYVPPPFSWIWLVQQSLPWNFPLVAAGLQLSLLVLLVRWTRWPAGAVDSHAPEVKLGVFGSRRAATTAIAILAVTVPCLAFLHGNRGTLDGKRLLVNQQGRLDWNTPQHDQYGQASAGTFGMLPSLVQSLGGRMQRSEAFDLAELETADAVLLLHPDQSLGEDQRQRIWQYVAEGGALLVVTDRFQPEYGLVGLPGNLLEPLSIRVHENTAASEAGYWEDNTSLAACPVGAISHLRGSRLMPGPGPALDVQWPARPLLAGRWCWSSPQYGVTWNGPRWLADQKLGDLPLMAEQRFGNGQVIIVSDSSNFTNEGLAEGYSFVAATLSYLANRQHGSGAWWRQASVLFSCLALLSLLALAPRTANLLAGACLLLAAVAISQQASTRASQIIPDGRLVEATTSAVGNPVAYIDASHVEPFNQLDWVFHAVDGLQLTLMRNGYLPLFAPEITRQRLERCAMLISIAPARSFSRREIATIDEFVRQGGILICTVGAEETAASETLLTQFGLRIPYSPVPTGDQQTEPEPMGHIRSLFLNARDYGAGDYRCGVTFDAAWPIEATKRDAEVLVRGRQDRNVVISQAVGRGTVVLVGDSHFAFNKNLEYIGGQPFTYGYENAHFWRWLLTRITGQTEFVPPPTEQPDSGVTAEPTRGSEEGS